MTIPGLYPDSMASTSGEHYQQSTKEFVCGASAGVVESCITFPLQKLIFRQQLHYIVAKEAVAHMTNDGWHRLYRGLLPPLCQRSISRAIMFGMYQRYQTLLGCEPNAPAFTTRHALAAFLSGTTEAIMCPMERIQVLLQHKEYHHKYRNALHAFTDIRSYGLREYYRGVGSVIARNGPSNTIFFMLREPLAGLIDKEDNTTSSDKRIHARPYIATFVSGGILGAIISTVFFPINVVKNYQMLQLGTAHESIITVLRDVLRSRNYSVLALYRGVQLNFLRSMLTWALTNTIYEMCSRAYADYFE